MAAVCGIYAWINKKTNDRYIGSSQNVHRRKQSHLRKLRNGTHENNRLQRAWDKYGEENFEFIILEKADPNSLLIIEQKWLDKYFGDTCYNICHIAGAPAVGGHIKSEYHRKKLSESLHKFYQQHPDHRTLLSRFRLGTTISEEVRRKMRASKKRGSKHHNSKLTETDVIAIRQKYSPHDYSYNKLASEYGVDKKTIIRIIQRKTWTHI